MTTDSSQNTPTHRAPFRFEVAPLRTFLEVPIDDDPTYVSIEVQVLAAAHDANRRVTGTPDAGTPDAGTPDAGMAVLLTRRSGEIDAYTDTKLDLDENWFETDGSTANVRRGMICARDFSTTKASEVPSRATIGVDQHRINADVSFVDADGRRIELQVDADRRATKPNGVNIIPAPRSPSQVRQLPFLFAPEFWLLTRAGSSIRVLVDGVSRSPTRFPVPVGLKSRYYARFATGLSLVSLNPTSGDDTERNHMSWTLDDADVSSSRAPGEILKEAAIDGSTIYRLTDSEAGDGCIHSVTSRGTATNLTMVFDPPLYVGLLQIHPGPRIASAAGVVRFYFGQATVGKGSYRSAVADGTIQFRLGKVVQDWRPPWSQASLFALSVVRRITRRGRSYTWTYAGDGEATTASWAEHGAGSRSG